jgi:hypothetical protein
MTKPSPRLPERTGRPHAARQTVGPEPAEGFAKVQLDLPDGRYLIAYGRVALPERGDA